MCYYNNNIILLAKMIIFMICTLYSTGSMT